MAETKPSDGDLLRFLAKYLDMLDERNGITNDQVQRDLRRIAVRVDKLDRIEDDLFHPDGFERQEED